MGGQGPEVDISYRIRATRRWMELNISAPLHINYRIVLSQRSQNSHTFPLLSLIVSVDSHSSLLRHAQPQHPAAMTRRLSVTSLMELITPFAHQCYPSILRAAFLNSVRSAAAARATRILSRLTMNGVESLRRRHLAFNPNPVC